LSELNLISQQKLTSQLSSGLLSSTGRAMLDGETVSGIGNIDLQNLTITAKGINKITNIAADTLEQLQELSINTDISGAMDNLDLSFCSDLNKQIGTALLSDVSAEQQAKLNELKQKLNDKTKGMLGDNNNQLAQWLGWEKSADGDLSSINKLLATKINNLVENNKNKLKKKLFDTLLN
jgi:uncharacterized protein (TIGR03545 family)